jgi:hypothetical protein
MNPNKEKEMKNMLRLILCTILVFGLALPLAAAQDKETSQSAQENERSFIKELTIRNSGFRSRSTIVIRYRDEDKKIVAVIENGKKLPPEEFSRYESTMRKILELPQIDRLLPEIDRARRRADSPGISEESKIHEMMDLRRQLEGLESDVARRYRNLNELQLMETLNKQAEKIIESNALSQHKKIEKLKEVIEKIKTMQTAKDEDLRRSGLAEFEAYNTARRLIAEIEKSDELSREEKFGEIEDTLRRMRDLELVGEVRHRELLEFEAANALRKMISETAQRKDLSEQEKEKEIETLLEEARNMKLETRTHVIGIEKFKYELHKLLEKEGLLPMGKAELVLKRNECTIAGKKLPKEIHERIMELCEKSIGMTFDHDTKIVLRLNEDRSRI